ncbi:MAG: hypothetical protein LBV09_02370 [Deferribacteraceae bacterium]|nr:hypothetical protein [Deferribacteraceae bacterium]
MKKVIIVMLLALLTLSACAAKVADERSYYRAQQQADKAHADLDRQ